MEGDFSFCILILFEDFPPTYFSKNILDGNAYFEKQDEEN
jgi:hypothetical protein